MQESLLKVPSLRERILPPAGNLSNHVNPAVRSLLFPSVLLANPVQSCFYYLHPAATFSRALPRNPTIDYKPNTTQILLFKPEHEMRRLLVGAGRRSC